MSEVRTQLLDILYASSNRQYDSTQLVPNEDLSAYSVATSEWQDTRSIDRGNFKKVFSKNLIDGKQRTVLRSGPLVLGIGKSLNESNTNFENLKILADCKDVAYEKGFFLLESTVNRRLEQINYIFSNPNNELLRLSVDNRPFWEYKQTYGTSAVQLRETLANEFSLLSYPQWFYTRRISSIINEIPEHVAANRAVAIRHPKLGSLMILSEDKSISLDLIDKLIDNSSLADYGRTYGLGICNDSGTDNIFVQTLVEQEKSLICPECGRDGLILVESSVGTTRQCNGCGHESDIIALVEDGMMNYSGQGTAGVVTGRVKPVQKPPFPGESAPSGMKEMCIGPADTDGHTHTGWVTAVDGNGFTSTDRGHNHEIANWEVAPGLDGHQHGVIEQGDKGASEPWTDKGFVYPNRITSMRKDGV